jgi:hypothetical protein
VSAWYVGGVNRGGVVAILFCIGFISDAACLRRQALSRDIRSVHQRTAPTAAEAPLYHVVLEGVEVAYRIVESRVEVVGGRAV